MAVALIEEAHRYMLLVEQIAADRIERYLTEAGTGCCPPPERDEGDSRPRIKG